MKKIILLLMVLFSASIFAAGAVAAYSCRTTCVDMGTVTGKWYEGETKDGPGILTLALDNPEVNVSNTIKGDYANLSSIQDALNVSFGKECFSSSAAFTCDVPEGETWRILYRGVYEKYQITKTCFSGWTISSHYKYQFQYWDFSHESV